MQLGEAQLCASPAFALRSDGGRLHLLESVEHAGDHRRVVVDLTIDRRWHGQLQLLGLDHRGRLGMGKGPAQDLSEMVVIFEAVGSDLAG